MPEYDLVLRLASVLSVMHEAHDHHGEGVSLLARDLAVAAGLDARQVELIRTGAHLHDIGKILVRRDLLNLPRKLEPVERKEMETHTTLGWALVEQAGFDPVICGIVRHHHERYDGNGYPDHLLQRDIPLPARIVGICDAYEALTSLRPYRPAYKPDFAQSYIQVNKGTAFDACLVDLFFEKVVRGIS